MESQLLHYPSPALLSRNIFKFNNEDTREIFSTDPEEIDRIEDYSSKLIYLRQKINELGRINTYLKNVNKKLKLNGLLVCNCETIEQRNKRIKNKYAKLTILFLPIDFLYKRFAPKVAGLKKIYFAISQGRNRVLSKAEVLGRLHYCGFQLIKMEEVDNRLHLIMKKVDKPSDEPVPSYGLIFKKKSIGKNGKPITIYKIRTMHPFSESKSFI